MSLERQEETLRRVKEISQHPEDYEGLDQPGLVSVSSSEDEAPRQKGRDLLGYPIPGNITQEVEGTANFTKEEVQQLFGKTSSKIEYDATSESLMRTEPMIIQAASAGYEGGNFAEVTINGNPVEFKMNENGNDRGLYLALINPWTGKVKSANIFDTYTSSDRLDFFIQTMSRYIPEGYILAAACKDDCATQLSPTAKDWFGHLGSKEIVDLKYRQGFAFIGVLGDEDEPIIEQRALLISDKVNVSQVFMAPTTKTQEELDSWEARGFLPKQNYNDPVVSSSEESEEEEVLEVVEEETSSISESSDTNKEDQSSEVGFDEEAYRAEGRELYPDLAKDDEEWAEREEYELKQIREMRKELEEEDQKG